MPHLTVAFSATGPVIDLYVGVSAQRREAIIKAGQVVPPFEIARALIDTGASGTCVDPAILGPLGLTPTGSISIHTPTTAGMPISCDQFDVALGIDHPKNPMVLLTVPVISTALAAQGIQALIGRDVLQNCLLIYDGAAGNLTLAF
jgi:hypothetical protein